MLRSVSKQRAKVASAEASAEASHLLSDLRVVGAQNDRFVQEALDRENAMFGHGTRPARATAGRVSTASAATTTSGTCCCRTSSSTSRLRTRSSGTLERRSGNA